ncbi:MAG: serine/threonine protein kinase, partial [Deltaproteobacteria bacterium]|nr:serine/threonine protein kinase [Nannocystaceae bacterium]
MPPELETLLDRIELQAPDSIEVRRLRQAVRARLLDETVAETRIDRYVVRERLGVGGMGVVYAARDAELDRDVAIKLVRNAQGPEHAADQQRLLREARALAQLSHPNVVAIYDVGLHRDRVFIAMELVRGATLRRHLAEHVRPWQEIVLAFAQAGTGLAAAHACGLVHRDFKPDNVLVGDDGRVRVVDFGLAQSDGSMVSTAPGSEDSPASPVLTATGQVVGTPAYMAPEQFAGEPADAATDQFSFCVAFWEALFGERPFPGSTSTELRLAIALGRIVTPAHPERAPQWLRAALVRGLATEPHMRWPSMHALLSACARRPSRLRHWKLVLGIATTAIVTAIAVRSAVAVARAHGCVTAAAEIDTLWPDGSAATIAAAFDAGGVIGAETSATKLDAALSAWRESWRGVSERSCVAHRVDRTLDSAQWRRREACLQEQRERLATLTEGLLKPERELVHRALQVAYDLPGNSTCEDDVLLAVRAAALGAASTPELVAELRRQLARAELLAST